MKSYGEKQQKVQGDPCSFVGFIRSSRENRGYQPQDREGPDDDRCFACSYRT